MQNISSEIEAAKETEVLTLRAFTQLAANGAPTEAWVRCTVVDKLTASGEDQLAIVDCDREDDEARCIFPDPIIHRLGARHQAEVNWDDMVGDTLTLKLLSRGAEPFEIRDVEPAWIDEAIRVSTRMALRDLAEAGQLGVQQLLPEPEVLRRVCLIGADDDPATLMAQDRLTKLGLDVALEQALFDGSRGRMSITMALYRAGNRVENGDADLVLIVSSAHLPSGLVALLDDDVARQVWAMGVPVVIGTRRPAVGSLLHHLAFSAHDNPTDAVAAIEGMVKRAHEAEAKKARIEAWNTRICERYPPDRW